MDFIEKLLSSSEFDTILVIVDWLTKQAIFISAHDTIMSVDLAHLFIFHVFLLISPPIKAWSLCLISSILYVLLWTCSFTSFQATTLKMMDKPNTQIRLLSNTSMYIVTTSKTTGLNSYLLQSLPTIMLQVLLPVFPHSLLIRDII